MNMKVIRFILGRRFHYGVSISAQQRTKTATRSSAKSPNCSIPPSSAASQVSRRLELSSRLEETTLDESALGLKSESPSQQTQKINFEELNQRVSRHYTDRNYKYTEGTPEAEGDREFRLSNHFYRRLYPWKSKEELAAYLCHQIVHQGDGVVAINKPFGVGARNVVQKRDAQFEIMRRSGLEVPKLQGEFDPLHHVRGIGSCNYTLEDVLPILRKKLGLPHLNLEKSTDKFTSGIAIFSSDETAGERIRHSMKMNKPIGVRTYSLYVISTNISKKFLPNGEPLTERIGISLAENQDTRVAHPIVMRDFSKHSMKDRDVKPVTVDLVLIDKNPALNVACSQLKTSSMKHNFLRVYYASIVSPILGDHLYSSRVAKIGGVMALVPPALARVGFGHQNVSKEVISAIRLRKLDDSIVIPLHAHLQCLTLGNFYGKKKHLQLIAPPTPLFTWTCKQLSLTLPQLGSNKDNNTVVD